ncbi:hypothetical protein SynMITS9220_02444 [Synechococcus sp. MIT S9220]|nr:hypothetical protein SynMITS9220_02444 [Synechococcus sp. MIT S9220]
MHHLHYKTGEMNQSALICIDNANPDAAMSNIHINFDS